MAHLSPLHGVPSLSRATSRLVLLRGRGKCQTINDIEWSDEVDSDSEVEAKGKKRRRVNDSEEEFTPKKRRDSPKEFSKRKTKTRITPRRQAKCSTATNKRSTPSPRTKLNLNVLDDDSELMSKYEYSPVPPVKRRATNFESELTDHSTPTATTSTNIDHVSQVADLTSRYLHWYSTSQTSSGSHQNGYLPPPSTKLSKSSNQEKQKLESKEAASNLADTNIEASENSIKVSPTTKKIEEVLNPSKVMNMIDKEAVTSTKKSSSSVPLPPGYGADQLAQVLICVLEEKVRVSSSHSERELFRKTIHVLMCEGCKDREKHNKVRCTRCEERDRRRKKEEKIEEKKKDLVKDETTSEKVTEDDLGVQTVGQEEKKEECV